MGCLLWPGIGSNANIILFSSKRFIVFLFYIYINNLPVVDLSIYPRKISLTCYHLLKRPCFPHYTQVSHLLEVRWLFWTPSCVLLVYLSVLELISYWLKNYNFIIYLDVWQCKFFSFVVQYCLFLGFAN